MPDEYNSSYTGAQIDNAVGKALDPDTTPTANSTNLVTSGGVKSALGFVPDTGNAGFHNSIYRGKSLGSSVTAAQWNVIDAGTFDDLYIGDYWTIPVTIGGVSRNIRWRIAGFDYWYDIGSGSGSSSVLDRLTHHVVIVPDQIIGEGTMNATATTSGGYVGSDFYTGNNGNTWKSTITSIINSAFGSSHIKTAKRYFTNSVSSSGSANGQVEVDSAIDLMSDNMLVGHFYGSGSVYYEIGYDRTILPLFLLDIDKMHATHCDETGRATFWMRNVSSSASFALFSYTGRFTGDPANSSFGFRPAFAIKG